MAKRKKKVRVVDYDLEEMTMKVERFNKFVSTYHPSGWNDKIETFVSTYQINIEEYLDLIDTRDIMSVTEYDNHFYYKEAVAVYFREEYPSENK